MSVFVSVLGRLCAQQSRRSRICAVAETNNFTALAMAKKTRTVRTVCGVDARPLLHGCVGEPGDAVWATWPPPKVGELADRCPDCARLLGVTGRKGDRYWDAVVTPEEALA